MMSNIENNIFILKIYNEFCNVSWDNDKKKWFYIKIDPPLPQIKSFDMRNIFTVENVVTSEQQTIFYNTARIIYNMMLFNNLKINLPNRFNFTEDTTMVYFHYYVKNIFENITCIPLNLTLLFFHETGEMRIAIPKSQSILF